MDSYRNCITFSRQVSTELSHIKLLERLCIFKNTLEVT